MILSVLNAAIQQPAEYVPRTRDLLFKGVVILEDQRESGTRLSLNLQQAICAADTVPLFMPVDFFTYERKPFLGRTLLIKGRLDAAASRHRPNVLIGKIVGEGADGSFTGMVFNRIGRYIDNMFRRHLSRTNYDLSSSLVLGGSSRVGKELMDVFTRSGVLHILSVSGLHVGFVFSFMGLLLLFLPISPRIKFASIMIILFIYAGITGFRPSVVRAGLMAFLFGLALILQRHVDSMHILNITALFVLVVSPAMLFDLGTQLSFVSVYGILYLYPRIEKALINRVKNRFLKMTATLMAVSFSAQLFVSPLVINYFHRIQTMAVFSNLIIVPLTSAITYMLFFSVMFGFIFAPGLSIVFALVSLMLKLLVSVSSFFAGLPFSSLSVSVSSVILLMFYFLFVRRLRMYAMYAMLAAALVITLPELTRHATIIKGRESALIEMPGGDRILFSRKNSLDDLFALNVSPPSYLIAGQDMCPHTKGFIRIPEAMHYKRLRFEDMVVDIGRQARIEIGQCVVDLDALRPGDGFLVYMLTNGRSVCRLERPVYCSLIEQIIADIQLVVAKYRLLFS